MPTYYNIQSQVTNPGGVPLVIDIQGGGATPSKNTPLDAYTPTGGDNQLWALEPDPSGSGYFYIESPLKDPDGHTLVIDIRGGLSAPPKQTHLDAYSQKSKDYDNQLWKFVEGPPGWYFIQSIQKDPYGNTLVIDIPGAGAVATPGFGKLLLQVYTQDPGSPVNQLWQLAG